MLEDIKAIPLAAPVDISRTRRYGTFAAIMLVYVFYSFCWNTENFLRPYVAQALGLSRIEVSAFYTAQASGALFGAIILSSSPTRWACCSGSVSVSTRPARRP